MGRCVCVPPNWGLGLFLLLWGLLVTFVGPSAVQARAARHLSPQPQPDQSHPKPAGGGLFSSSNDVLPNSWVWGCQNISSSYPFCDPTLDIDTRVNDLLERLTPQEAMNFMGSSDRNKADNCDCEDGGVPRLGIPGFTSIVETNSAVASHCIGPGQCATEFPSPAALAASFNKTLWREKGRVISTELRAFNNHAWYRGRGPSVPISLQGFGPNINIVRDPRFGRNSELPSEDPLLTGRYAVEYVRGCQEGDDPRYQKMIAGLKHYALYSVESDRPSFVPNVSLFDLYDTYLPQYEMAFRKVEQGGGQATSVMCSYAGRNGIPSCANNNLINEIVRHDWDREDVIVSTDCGAISNMVNYNHYAKNDVDAAAKTLNGGADIDLGDMYFSPASQGGNGALLSALQQNLTTWNHVWASVRRILTARFRLGIFDPREMQPYYHIGIENINSTAHYNLLLESAEQAMVLLKNDDHILPFNRMKTTAVLGPHIVSQEELFEDYHGDQLCYGGGVDCIRTIAEVFTTTQAHDRMGAVYTSQGVYMQGNDSSMMAAAIKAAQQADQIVLCLGIGIKNQEHETLDRTEITLPGLQESFAAKVLALGKPTVLVFINGGAVAFENLLALNNTKAIIEAFYPAQRGAEALFNAIYGLSNRWGKLPITLYQSHFIHEQDMHDFDMTTKPGRTYRYYTGEPMFTFGSGLSYTTFSYSVSVSSSNALDITHHNTVWMDMETQQTQHTTKGSYSFVSDPSLTLTVSVSNVGLFDGDEILLIYHRFIPSPNITISHPIPQRSLIDFTRVTLPCSPDPQHTTTVAFTISKQQLAITGHDGNKVVYKGNHQLIITDHVQPEQIITVSIP